MSQFSSVIYHADCRHFRGDIPCLPHKKEGVHCDGCPYYDKITENILIVKLGAAGDVIRTTPLLHRLKGEHPNARIWWLTHSPDLVPSNYVDKILPWNSESIETLHALEFEWLINLDKDHYACSFANTVRAKKKSGFVMGKFGESEPADSLAVDKFMTGIFDDVNLSNTKDYPTELFEICGYEFRGERYILDVPSDVDFPLLNTSNPIVGMNTGAGARWTSRLWGIDQWAALADKLTKEGYTVLLLGGPDEDARNKEIEELTDGRAKYLGYFPLKQFIALVEKCSVIITGVTMCMHIAIALRKRLVLMNNIFNRYEFGDLYGLGEIVEPDKKCICFFRGTCINPDYFCLDHLPVPKLFDAALRVSTLATTAPLI